MTELFAQLSLLVASLLCLGWALVLARVWRSANAFRQLPSTAPASAELNMPKVSAVIAARDEEGGIEAAVRSLLAQEGVDIEVIVVDDMSSDGTLAILQKLEAEFAPPAGGSGAHKLPKLLVLEQKKLPPGWIGKSYAVELGQGRARGDWLLFTDADVLHGPRALWNAVSAMERERLDHLALFPRLEAGSLVEALVLPLFVLLYQIRFVDPRATEPSSPHGTGIGAFNMVKADAYRLRGTHARIRQSVVDDIALGQMMRDEGGRGTVMRAVGQVRLRPYRSMKELYFGIKKSVLAQFNNSAVVAAAAAALLVVAALLPFALVLAGLPLWWKGHAPWLVVPAALAALFPMAGLLKARSMLRFEPLAALLFPIGALVIATSAIHAAVIFGVKGTVEWRGRVYTKKDLGVG